jgi:hypothetical protein
MLTLDLVLAGTMSLLLLSQDGAITAVEERTRTLVEVAHLVMMMAEAAGVEAEEVQEVVETEVPVHASDAINLDTWLGNVRTLMKEGVLAEVQAEVAIPVLARATNATRRVTLQGNALTRTAHLAVEAEAVEADLAVVADRMSASNVSRLDTLLANVLTKVMMPATEELTSVKGEMMVAPISDITRKASGLQLVNPTMMHGVPTTTPMTAMPVQLILGELLLKINKSLPNPIPGEIALLTPTNNPQTTGVLDLLSLHMLAVIDN